MTNPAFSSLLAFCLFCFLVVSCFVVLLFSFFGTKLSDWLRSVSQKLTVFGRPLQVTVRPMLQDRCPVCLVFNVGVLWPNGWMDQDAT